MVSGDLQTFGLIDILSLIKKDGKSCILILESKENGHRLAVYFKNGNPLFIRKITKSFIIYFDLDFESILRKEGIIKKEIFKHFVENLPILLSFKKGRFSISSGFIKYPVDTYHHVDPEKLIMSLSRNLLENEIDRKVSDDNLVYERVENYTNLVEKALLTEFEKEVLDLINGINSIGDIESEMVLRRLLKNRGGYVDFDEKEIRLSVRRAIYGFLSCGIIKQHMKLRKSENIFDRILQLLENKKE